MKKWEKSLEALALIFIIVSIVIKIILGASDTGILVILSFLAIMLYVIFLVCAFFPADWRMTEKQKSKIKNMKEYQSKYRNVFVGVNLCFAIMSSILILVCA